MSDDAVFFILPGRTKCRPLTDIIHTNMTFNKFRRCKVTLQSTQFFCWKCDKRPVIFSARIKNPLFLCFYIYWSYPGNRPFINRMFRQKISDCCFNFVSLCTFTAPDPNPYCLFRYQLQSFHIAGQPMIINNNIRLFNFICYTQVFR